MTAEERIEKLNDRIEKLNDRIEKLEIQLAATRPEVEGTARTIKASLRFASGLALALIGLLVTGLIQAGVVYDTQKKHTDALNEVRASLKEHTSTLSHLDTQLDDRLKELNKKLELIGTGSTPSQ